MVTDERYALSKCSKYILTEKWNYMVVIYGVKKLQLQQTCQANGQIWGMSDGFLALLGAPMVTDGASIVPAGRYAFPESRKGLVTVKKGIMW